MTELARGEVFKAAELLQYQEQGIVSRILVRAEKGSVTLMAFDKGQELSEHSAPFDALVHLLEGEAQVIIGGKENRLQGGDVVVMPANIPHAVKAPERFKMLLTMIRA